MFRVSRALILSAGLTLGLIGTVPASVGAAQTTPPTGPNGMKLTDGQVGADSVRIRVQHDPAAFRSESWKVLRSQPGEAAAPTELACDWSVTGAPADTAGLFFCDLLNLPAGNHFLTLEAVNANRTDSDPNTYAWHTTGPATGIVSPELPGNFATPGSAGTYDDGDVTATVVDRRTISLAWPAHTASDRNFPTIGYSIEVTTDNGTSKFVADRTAMELNLTPTTFGAATITIFPVTSRGLINDALTSTAAIPETVPSVAEAATLGQILTAGDYDATADAEVLRFYVAYFNRQPDLAGAKYWLGIRRQAFVAQDIAGFMAGSREFANNYAGTSDTEYLTAIYANILGREFDQDGFDYWLDTLQGTNASGLNPDLAQISRSDVVFWVARSEEFINANPFAAG